MKCGAALPAVLLALALVNALVVGALFVARRQAAAARLDAVGAPLQPIAERAVVRAIVAWDSLERARQPIGVSVLDAAGTDPDATVWITRTAADLYWIVGEARTRARPAMSRRVGAIVRWVDGAPALAFPRGWAELP